MPAGYSPGLLAPSARQSVVGDITITSQGSAWGPRQWHRVWLAVIAKHLDPVQEIPRPQHVTQDQALDCGPNAGPAGITRGGPATAG